MLKKLVPIPAGAVSLEGMLEVPQDAQGVALFAHGSGTVHATVMWLECCVSRTWVRC